MLVYQRVNPGLIFIHVPFHRFYGIPKEHQLKVLTGKGSSLSGETQNRQNDERRFGTGEPGSAMGSNYFHLLPQKDTRVCVYLYEYIYIYIHTVHIWIYIYIQYNIYIYIYNYIYTNKQNNNCANYPRLAMGQGWLRLIVQIPSKWLNG